MHSYDSRQSAESGEAWIPETPGDEVEDRFAGLTRGHGKSGDPRLIVNLVDDAGRRRAVWLWHTQLRASFRQLRPELRERARVVYLGRRQSQGDPSGTYAMYDVSCPDREPETLTWDDLDLDPDDDDDDEVAVPPAAQPVAPRSDWDSIPY